MRILASAAQEGQHRRASALSSSTALSLGSRLAELDLEALQGGVLLQELVSEAGDLGLGLLADLVEGGLEAVDAAGEAVLEEIIVVLFTKRYHKHISNLPR